LSASLFSLATFAFPANLANVDISASQLAEINDLVAKVTRDLKEREGQPKVEKRAIFNADAQRISNTGAHRYIAPGPNDLRGPCPGLNVMANHGYLPRNGVASVAQLTTASNEVFGMGLDLAAFLAVYSAVVAGDLTSCSIGGKPKSGLLGGLTSSLGLLGEPQGLNLSHNRFEVDASPTRRDQYIGDPVSLDIELFEQMVNSPLGPNGYDLTVMYPRRVARFKDSIATNGHAFFGPVVQYALQPATYLFTYQFFANRSAEYPEGYLDLETLKSFQGVTGEKGNFKWTWGGEKIPDNWYRRDILQPYLIESFTAEAVGMLLVDPELIVVGGNTGTPNSFAGVNVVDLTGGVYNAQNLLEGNNAMCFALQNIQQGAPDLLRGLVGNVVVALQKLTGVLDPLLATLNCPQIAKYDPLLLSKYPGAEGSI